MLKLTDTKGKETTILTFENGIINTEVEVIKDSCCECKHCTDIFWDYSNGIYGICCSCKADPKIGFWGECNKFEKEGD